jgi:hypothetical protein
MKFRQNAIGTNKINYDKYSAFRWSDSHGVTKDKLGAVEDYINLISKLNPKNALVIGSGSGFIPYVILENSDAEVILVDALIAETGNGAPMEFEDSKDNFYSNLKHHKNRFLFVEALSNSFFEFAIQNSWKFDLIFIDGDHSVATVRNDFRAALQVASNQSLIFFHDTNMPWIREIADQEFGSWHNINKGCGTGVYSPKSNNSLNIDLCSIKHLKPALLKKLKSSRNANHWEYLRNKAFEERFLFAESELVKKLGCLDGLNLLEIGGNPSPFSAYLIKKGHAIKAVNVEPVIADSARDDFDVILSQEGLVVSAIDMIENHSFDIVVFFGLDLSLSQNYRDFLTNILSLHQHINKSNFVILEASNFTPSLLLLKALSKKLDVISRKTLKIPLDVSRISVSSIILNRYILFGTPVKILNDLDFENNDLITSIARLYSLPETPVLSIRLDFGFFDVDQIACLIGYAKEADGEIQFSWLPERLTMNFSRMPGDITFTLLPSFSTLLPSFMRQKFRYNLFYFIKVSDGFLKIYFTLLGRLFFQLVKKQQLNIKFPHFVPNQIDPKSNDSRRLSYPVTSLTVGNTKQHDC